MIIECDAGPGENAQVKVIDISGRVMRALEMNAKSGIGLRTEWDGTMASGRPAPSGIYFYQVESQGVEISVGKFIWVR